MYKRQKFKKQPVTEVSIILPEEGKNQFEIHFIYDLKIIELMRKLKKLHGGHGYQRYPVPHWEFPLKEQTQIIDTLKRSKLHVKILKRRESFPQDITVHQQLGYCKECGKYDFCYESGECGRCR